MSMKAIMAVAETLRARRYTTTMLVSLYFELPERTKRTEHETDVALAIGRVYRQLFADAVRGEKLTGLELLARLQACTNEHGVYRDDIASWEADVITLMLRDASIGTDDDEWDYWEKHARYVDVEHPESGARFKAVCEEYWRGALGA